MTKVNVMLAETSFLHLYNLQQPEMLDCRKNLAKALIQSDCLSSEQSPLKYRRLARVDFGVLTVATAKREKNDSLQIIASKSDLPQKTCMICKKEKTRKYCRCNVGVHICTQCW